MKKLPAKFYAILQPDGHFFDTSLQLPADATLVLFLNKGACCKEQKYLFDHQKCSIVAVEVSRQEAKPRKEFKL